MMLILLQRGKGVGLAGAFGGAGGTTAFGAKTGDMLTWVTIVGTGVLLTLAVDLELRLRGDRAGFECRRACARRPRRGPRLKRRLRRRRKCPPGSRA